MVDNNHVGHALLFNGPEGNAKLQLALAFAQYLNCDDRHDGDSCGVCPSCTQFAKLAHPDLHFIFPVGTSKLKKTKDTVSDDFIEEWREFIFDNYALGTLNNWYNCIKIDSGIINALDCNGIIKTLSYTSYQSKYKIMVIWMVEKLFYAAAPKILKILEEPSENTLFLLITENRAAILDTIISRTQSINIPEFTNDDIKNILIKRNGLSEQEAIKIAAVADGNAATALSCVLMPEARMTAFDDFISWMRVCIRSNMNEILPHAEQISKRGREGCTFFLKSALSLLQQALFLNETGQFIMPMPENQTETFTKFSRFVNKTNIINYNTAIDKSIKNIERNGYIPLIMTNLTIALCRIIKQK